MKQERITSTGYILKKGIMYIQDPKTKTKEKTKRNKTKAALLNDILQSWFYILTHAMFLSMDNFGEFFFERSFVFLNIYNVSDNST
jgi:hypothetical protein